MCCWMTASTTEDGSAARKCFNRIREHECHNPHAWGMAWIDTHSGDIMFDKGVGITPSTWRPPKADVAIGHVRFSTAGTHTNANAHPFPVFDGDEIVAVLAHNGTFTEFAGHPVKSDTRIAVERIQEFYDKGASIEQAFKAVAQDHGETVLMLTADGAVKVHAGRFTITKDGSEIASSGFEEIPQGKIVTA